MERASLLTDKQVQDFLINGYLILRPTSLDQKFHSKIFTDALSIYMEEGNHGNNILPRIPQLQSVFDEPKIKGALTSLLGPNYTMQPHRHPHLNSPGSKAQLWHKDSYFGYRKILRHHQLRYIMAMYYPQETTMPMGPTAIKPRSQYDVIDLKFHRHKREFDQSNGDDDRDHDIHLVCPAGTVVLIHYDLVHRGTSNQSMNSHRFMFKFQFHRTEEPTEPSWNHDVNNDAYEANDADLLRPIIKHVWSWMMGCKIQHIKSVTDQEIITWTTNLNHRDGKVRLNAAYNLALNQQYDVLISRLCMDEEIFYLEASYALTAGRNDPRLIIQLKELFQKERNHEQIIYCLAFILSEIGPNAASVLPLIVDVMESNPSWLVKLYCCEALGTIPSDERDFHAGLPYLINVLNDQPEQKDHKDASHARLTAAFSISKMGVHAVSAVPVLKHALYFDPNRYVNGNALLALERIGTKDAWKTVLDYLNISRWCSKTTTASLY